MPADPPRALIAALGEELTTRSDRIEVSDLIRRSRTGILFWVCPGVDRD
jgi:hypothetical protein